MIGCNTVQQVAHVVQQCDMLCNSVIVVDLVKFHLTHKPQHANNQRSQSLTQDLFACALTPHSQHTFITLHILLSWHEKE